MILVNTDFLDKILSFLFFLNVGRIAGIVISGTKEKSVRLRFYF